MAFQDDMNAAWTAKEQQEELFKFRAKVQDIANNLKNGRNELDAIAAGAKFNTLSTFELTTALLFPTSTKPTSAL